MNRFVLFLFLVGSLFVFIGISNPNFTRVKNLQEVKSSNEIATPAPIPQNSPQESKSQTLITKVVDGDTVETSLGEKIRYIGINSPENGEPFSKQATDKNKELVLNKNVRLEFDVEKKDRFGRTLAYVFVQDLNVSIELAKAGVAVSQTLQPNVKYQKEILDGQKSARDNCLGLWKDLCLQKSVHGISTSCIKIETINANAPGNDNQNKNGEWIKIGNSCSESASMDGWMLKDNSSSNRYNFKNFTLNSNSEVTIFSGCGQNTAEKLYWQCPEKKYAVWNNTSDHAFLYNDKGELVSDYEY